MTRADLQRGLPPFEPGYRASGILLHVTSLPSPYGIGDVGPVAFSWIDRLQEAGQTWWQALPLGPTGLGNSPYQCLSSFAGNGLLVSPDLLVHDGLLTPEDCAEGRNLPQNAVDFDAVIAFKHRLLERAWSKFSASPHPELQSDFDRFCSEHSHWLDDYSLFRALKASYQGADFLKWPEELVKRNPSALARARRELADKINESRFAQFLLYRQGEGLKEYARSRGIRLIGDVPFFVSPDSSDVWANPQWFQLDDGMRPRFVAGVPPDYFSAKGQLWGNPVYDWESLRQSGYRWCIDRLKALLSHVDVVRLDHFRGFCAAWHVAPTARTAESGRWVQGPGADFFKAVFRELGHLPFIAEDLGLITPDVIALRDQFALPGMRILQFAFDGSPDNPHLPNNFTENTVVYTGTHDNPTTRGWFEALPEELRRVVSRYFKPNGATNEKAAWEMTQLAWSSRAGLAMVPLQDLLNLGAQGRMNIPGTAEGNWRWRCTEEMLSPSVFDRLRELTLASARNVSSEKEHRTKAQLSALEPRSTEPTKK
jgi:4-alpha-glucanotransferase